MCVLDASRVLNVAWSERVFVTENFLLSFHRAHTHVHTHTLAHPHNRTQTRERSHTDYFSLNFNDINAVILMPFRLVLFSVCLYECVCVCD